LHLTGLLWKFLFLRGKKFSGQAADAFSFSQQDKSQPSANIPNGIVSGISSTHLSFRKRNIRFYPGQDFTG
jgi:hypothetical protein